MKTSNILKVIFEHTESTQFEYFNTFWQSANVLRPIFLGYQANNHLKTVKTSKGFKLRPKGKIFETRIPIGQKRNGMVKTIPFWLLKKKYAGVMKRSILKLFAAPEEAVQYGGQKIKIFQNILRKVTNKSSFIDIVRDMHIFALQKTYSSLPSKQIRDVVLYIHLTFYLFK